MFHVKQGVAIVEMGPPRCGADERSDVGRKAGVCFA